MTATTRTPSLRRRVIVMVLGLLTVLLVVLGVAIDLVVGSQARRDLHDRLMATAARADALAAANTPPERLVAQLGGGGIRALLITPDGTSYGDHAISPDTTAGATELPPAPPPWGPPPPPWGPPPPPPPWGPPPPDATAAVVVHPLNFGGKVILVADTTQTTALLRRLREVMVVASLAILAAAGLLLILVTGAALRPLDRLTTLARSITTGDRGRRLRPNRPNTELGRAAAAFDGMLDALEASEDRARQSAESAQRAEEATRRFLVDAAHELRTPIAGILVAAEQLVSNAGQHQHDDAARGQYRRASLLLSDARRAGRLVADMLDLSRIDAGLPLDLQDVDLAALLDAEADRAAMLAPRVTVVRTGLDELEVKADPTRLAQILSNLLDNARRYTPAGGAIHIELRSGDHIAEVLVADTGPGVPADERDRIFERLVRLDAGRGRDHGGAGLGLPIARALARAHGGDLTCLPREGGAQFRLSLPLDAGVN